MTKVYADLEVLLDTRAAQMKLLDPQALLKWGSAWHTRVHELNPDVRFGTTYTHDEFTAAWENRDAEEIIGNSIPTKLLWDMGLVVSDWQKNQKVGFVNPCFTLVVNTYPYMFTDETKEALAAGIVSFLGPSDGVEIIYRDPATILPTEIRANYTIVIFDRIDLWFAQNAKHLEDNQIPNVLFIVKKLLMRLPAPEDDLIMLFESLEVMHSVLMFYRHFNMEWFSYHIPDPGPEPQPQQQPDSTTP